MDRWLVALPMAWLLAAPCAWLPAAAARAAGTPPVSEASEPVEALHAALLGIMRDAGALGQEGREERLAPVVDRVYDLDFMGEKVLGRGFAALTAEQQARWLAAFRRLTISTYAHRFDGFSGQRFEVLETEPAPRDTALVHTRLLPGEAEPVELDYRMLARDGSWRIVDVYLNGTVSELALRRSEYSSVLRRDGFDALVSAIEAKIRDPGPDPEL